MYDDATARVYENTLALPRARLVARWRTVPDAAAALAAVHDPAFDPRREAIVEGEVPPPPRAADDAAPGSARIVAEAAEQVEVEVDAARPGLLVLADLHFPGWHVDIDGAERTLLRADYLLRAVPVEAGVHRVRFRYAPWTVPLGAAISATTAVVVAVALLLDARGMNPAAASVTP